MDETLCMRILLSETREKNILQGDHIFCKKKLGTKISGHSRNILH